MPSTVVDVELTKSQCIVLGCCYSTILSYLLHPVCFATEHACELTLLLPPPITHNRAGLMGKLAMVSCGLDARYLRGKPVSGLSRCLDFWVDCESRSSLGMPFLASRAVRGCCRGCVRLFA